MLWRGLLVESDPRQESGEPAAAIWRKSLNVRTPMGSRRAPTEAAIEPATQETEMVYQRSRRSVPEGRVLGGFYAALRASSAVTADRVAR